MTTLDAVNISKKVQGLGVTSLQTTSETHLITEQGHVDTEDLPGSDDRTDDGVPDSGMEATAPPPKKRRYDLYFNRLKEELGRISTNE